MQPLVKEIFYQSPADVFVKFASRPWAILLESAMAHSDIGRYSFIVLDPFTKITVKNQQISIDGKILVQDPWFFLRQVLSKYSLLPYPELPPFQGGMVGFFSYELLHHLEKVLGNHDDMQLPDLLLGCYDLVIAFDHQDQRSFIFSSGLPEQEVSLRQQRAAQRLDWLLAELSQPSLTPLRHKQDFTTALSSNFNSDDYQQAVRRAKEYIFAGDIFQVNLSQRFSVHLNNDLSLYPLYQRLRRINPAPYAGFLQFDDTTLIAASPERFLRLQQNQVETRPIKGTSRRDACSQHDQYLAKALLDSEKNRAENTMIVDLLRNDLSRVCQPHSVQVTQWCGLETYATVHHLVSRVQAKLMPEKDAIDLLQATFPGGSITGAPKVRAMEIIAELEPCQRGPYCGAFGYLGFDGDMDMAITIRTFVIKNQQLTFHVGGGIVVDSDPAQEYEETLVKAQALFATLMAD